jgi:hypothetical protein
MLVEKPEPIQYSGSSAVEAIGKKKGANWIWDLYISVGIGQDLGGWGQKLTLVTTDGDILKAARHAGLSPFVSRLKEYLTLLGRT